MEYLGEKFSDLTCIVRLSKKESEAILRLVRALTRTTDKQFVSEEEYQSTVNKAIEAMNQLSEVLEAGPVKLTFEPVEVPLGEAVKA